VLQPHRHPAPQATDIFHRPQGICFSLCNGFAISPILRRMSESSGMKLGLVILAAARWMLAVAHSMPVRQ